MFKYNISISSIFLCFIITASFMSCQVDEPSLVIKEQVTQKKEVVTPPAINLSSVKKGKIIVKLKPDVATTIRFSRTDNTVSTNKVEFNKFITHLGVKNMVRMFPNTGKFEKRKRKEGLHLWYVVNFDEETSVDKAIREAQTVKNISQIEPVYEVEVPQYKAVEIEPSSVSQFSTMPFNDPNLKLQWHYQNTQPLLNSDPEADISLFDAWKKETGKPNVIVSVLDGGVDYEHEDLKDNMWVNEAEKNGQPDVDDDNNGYVDDIYGVNFVAVSDGKKGEISKDDHATHVAGTVAAKNNNGIGVCGVAGGDGTPNSGVRVMGAQVIYGRGISFESMANGIIYSADNGAIIAQCSWGFPKPTGITELPKSIKEAIDYFVKYAGCDENGNQLPTSPMKGGLLCFASGNDGYEYRMVPAYYEPIVAVGSFDQNLKMTPYTVYGTWLDILAPGGLHEAGNAAQVYSTFKDNRYGYFEGTSMACPHVSGVAALIVSKFGGQGFTNTELRKRLLGGVKDINVNERNPEHIGKVGVGYLDASRALDDIDTSTNKAPTKPKFISVVPGFDTLELKWTASTDENDGTPNVYKIYYSETQLDDSNYQNAESYQMGANGYKEGSEVEYALGKLKLDTHYYLAVQAIDRWGLASGVDFIEGRTKVNHNPKITRDDNKPIYITGQETAEIKLSVEEPDGNKWDFELAENQDGVKAKKEGEKIKLTFKVVGAFGKHTLKVIVKDEFGGAAQMQIPFEYYNSLPVLVKELKTQYLPIGENFEINLKDYFQDPEKRRISYSVSSESDLVSVEVDNTILSVKGLKKGFAKIKISVIDSADEMLDVVLVVRVVDNGIINAIYPMQVKDKLNIMVDSKVYALKCKIYTPIGKLVFRKNVVIPKNKRNIALDISKLSSGTYIFKAEDAKGNKYEKAFLKY